MNYQFIPSSSHLTTKWTGGTTTQLFIYPAESSVEARNFDFRISTAKVEVSESTFTPFLGYHRTLLILEGGIEIRHKSHHQKVLNKFDQDFFKGDWETSSRGTCIDFNVIHKPSIANSTNALTLSKGEAKQLDFFSDWLVVYVHKGLIKFWSKNTEYVISAGELLVISEFENGTIELIGIENSEVILVRLSKK